MKKALLVVFLILAIPFALYWGITAISFFRGEDLSVTETGVKTRYIFRFGSNREVIINDEFSQIVRAWDGSPVSILLENATRTIVFDEPAILKTSAYSIEPQFDYVKVGGYMGSFTNGTHFYVDRSGIISSRE